MEIELLWSQKINMKDHEDAQLRYDLFRGRWVLIAAARGKKPSDFIKQDKKEPYEEQKDLFADPEKSLKEPDTLIYKDENGEWTTRVFPNKFPVVASGGDPSDLSVGPYPTLAATGTHEVVVTRDGRRTFALLKEEELAEVIDAYQERYLAMMRLRSVRSITIFHNHGKGAGGTIAHPHSQILTLPVVSSTVMHEITTAENYKLQAGVHLFEVIGEYELEANERIVYENDDYIVYCPYASRRAFEMRILPKKPSPYFERITVSEKMALADALRTALKALYDGLDDPDYNYYIRTAPCNGQTYEEFSYYVEILPRTHIQAGFEAATDIDIVPLAPEDAAKFLRDVIGKNAYTS